MRAGRAVYCPVAHGHAIALQGLPTDWSYWERSNRYFVETCDEVIELKLDGWKESDGVQAEIRIARGLGMPVGYLDVTRGGRNG